MRCIIQRVRKASLVVEGEASGEIGAGVVALIGIERGDGEREAERMVERIVSYRLFADERGRMNRSLLDAGGALMLVPNFTVAADTKKGTRASFSTAADPEAAASLFSRLAEAIGDLGITPVLGRFGARMEVSLVNDGPVSFILEV